MRHNIQHIHFIGVGGAGMSGIAEVLFNLGYSVSGSDRQASAVTRRLADLGLRIHIGHQAEQVAGAQVVVVSTAIAEDNPEIQAARSQGIPVVPRALMLAELMRLKSGIAVAGTHGKTTTTSLLTSILAMAGMDPTFIIGGKLNAVAANARLGSGAYLVAEADESDASFLNLLPIHAIITNIDSDHMDTYGHSMEKLCGAFVDFTHRLPFYGSAVVCGDDPHIQSIVPQIPCKVIQYGFEAHVQFQAFNVQAHQMAMHFQVRRPGALPVLTIQLNLPGRHNVLNALAAIAMATQLGVPDSAIEQALAQFRGVGRRFTHVGDFPFEQGQVSIIDDYGHHPAEMAATIAAVRGAWPQRRLVLAFQPHRYSRTRDCFEDFVNVLSQVDSLLLTEVYAAGESPLVAADGRSLCRALRVAGHIDPIFVASVTDLPAAIKQVLRPDDVVLCMGAGSIAQTPEQLAMLLGDKHA